MEDQAIEAYGVFYFGTGDVPKLALDEADYGLDFNEDGDATDQDVDKRCILLMTDLTLSQLKGTPEPLPR